MSLRITIPGKARRDVFVVAALLFICASSYRARADDAAAPAPPAQTKPAPPSAMVQLINRLAERGVLTKQDAADLVSQAEADSAEARVQAAEAYLAAAKAEAAAARARAEAARANAALARAQANQAAAVRVLLGQGASPGVPATAAVPTPDVEPPAEVTPSEAVPAPSVVVAPNPRARAAREAAVVAAEEATPDATPAAPSPVPEDQQDPVVAAAAPSKTTDATPDEAVTVPDDQVPVVTAPSANPDSTTLKLTRNEEGAIVVPEDSPDDKSQDASMQSDDTPPPRPKAKKKTASLRRSLKAVEPSDSDGVPEASPKESVDDLLDSAGAPSASGASAAQAQAGVSDGAGPPTMAAEEPASPVSDAESLSPAAETTAAATPVQVPAAQPSDVTTVPPDEAEPRKVAAAPMPKDDDVVSVPYVPDVVKNQIRDEVKNEVVAELRNGTWGPVTSGPEWVSKFTLYGDIRIRAEEIINHNGNNNTGAFPDFNVINTGAPFDTAGNVFSPQYDVDQNRNRERLRARLGAKVDLKNGFTAEIRIATGNDDNPVTENQTFGAVGDNSQGGDFSKYQLWLDRAYVKYTGWGDPSNPFWITAGRFNNPFFSTPLIWANEIGFDGFAANIPIGTRGSSGILKDFKPFLVGGAFPVYNTSLNYPNNQPAKFKSYDKWLYAGQVGFDTKLGDDLQLKAAAALYDYQNIEGQLSSPFTPLTTSDAGDTDASRPTFAQNGNTYMAIRDIIPGPLNNNGTIDQFQYYGLATPFRELAFTGGLYYNHFEPIQISLVSEWVKNTAFDETKVAPVAVNNGGPNAFIGGNTGWITTLKFGDAVIEKAGDWSASVGYRRVESDAVVDGFNDADFGGVLLGTNLKGYTLIASVGIANGVWIEGRWYSATAIAGPIYKNDDFQFDLNVKF